MLRNLGLFSAVGLILSALISAIVISTQAIAQQAIAQKVELFQDEMPESRFVFFAPFDAPFVSRNYRDRLDAIVSSIQPDATWSFLAIDPTDRYSQIIREGNLLQWSLSERGVRLLRDSTRAILGVDRSPTEGYLQFRTLRFAAADELSKDEPSLDRARDLLIALFAEGEAQANIQAMQALKHLETSPIERIHRDLMSRSRDRLTGGVRLYLPNPDDIDIATNWSPLVLRSAGDSRQVNGLVSHIEVSHLGTDHILEGLISPLDRPEQFLMPTRLWIAKQLTTVESPSATESIDSPIDLILPSDFFATYAQSFTEGPSVIFLLAVELEERFQ